MNRRVSVSVALTLLVIILALSVSSVAMAQSTTRYQLGCWGLVSAGGGVQSFTMDGTNHRVIGSTGQWAVGMSLSPYHAVQGGYMQPASSGTYAAAEVSSQQVGPPPDVYLPLVSNFIKVVYVCPY